jgi:hypothetical protein
MGIVGWTAIIIGGVVVLVWVGMILVQVAADLRVVSVNVPCVVMQVGETETVTAYLLHKPRWTTKFTTVTGAIEFFRSQDYYKLVPTESLGRSIVVADQAATQQLNGLSVGNFDQMAISNDPNSALDFKEQYVPVNVVAGGTSLMDMLRLTAKTAAEKWYHGIWGNWFPNFFGGQCTGRCDQWADWLNGWLQNHNYGQVCRIEKCFFNVTGFGFRHVSLRITLCESREVFYIDGHANPDNPICPKADYEKERGEPEDVWQTYSR